MNRQPRLDTEPIRCAHAHQPAQRPHCQLTAVVAYGPVALCTDCDTRRSTLGKGVTPRRLPPQPPLDVLGWVAHADQQQRRTQTELTAAVRRARSQGHPWSAIAAELKITRQAAQQRFTHHPAARG